MILRQSLIVYKEKPSALTCQPSKFALEILNLGQLLKCENSVLQQGTTVIPNLTSVLADKDYWKFPLEFNPENFLNVKGEFVKPDAFLPFSTGE